MKSCLGRSTPSLKPFFDCRGRECFAELACSRADTSTPGMQSWVSNHSKKADSPQHSGSYACRSPQDTDCLKEHQFLFLTSGKKLLHSCQQEMLQVCILTIHQSVKTGNIQLGTAPVHAAVLGAHYYLMHVEQRVLYVPDRAGGHPRQSWPWAYA